MGKHGSTHRMASEGSAVRDGLDSLTSGPGSCSPLLWELPVSGCKGPHFPCWRCSMLANQRTPPPGCNELSQGLPTKQG